MNRKRLVMMQEALQKAIDADSKLYMGSWAIGDLEPRLGLRTGDTISFEDAHSCGTACCIGGWAGSHPGLQAEGLTLVVGDYYSVRLRLHGFGGFTITRNDDANPSLAGFFDLTDIQAMALFNDSLDGYKDVPDEEYYPSMSDAWIYRGRVMFATLGNAILLIDKIIDEGEDCGG